MTFTTAQLELIALLVNEAVSDPDSVERRWEKAARFARERAKEGYLLLTRDWTADTVLGRTGEVIVIDTEGNSAPRPATVGESRIALFRAIERYSELLSFLPARPVDASTCVDCGGTGVLAVRFQDAALRQVVCRCGGAGWTSDSG